MLMTIECGVVVSSQFGLLAASLDASSSQMLSSSLLVVYCPSPTLLPTTAPTGGDVPLSLLSQEWQSSLLESRESLHPRQRSPLSIPPCALRKYSPRNLPRVFEGGPETSWTLITEHWVLPPPRIPHSKPGLSAPRVH